MMALCMEIPIGFKMAKKVIHLLHLQDLLEPSPLLLFLIGQVQVLGMTAVAPPSAPQVLPSAIRREPNYNSGNNGAGLEGRISPKRAYYAAFETQMGGGSADEMVDEEEMMMFATAGAGGETGAAAAAALLKKRRLTMEQVRYLESSFESENKLEPERKAEIARQLGLQPRQVAVWFQNRRARSKNKQLERDYNVLKADYHAVLKENEELRAEVQRLNDLLQQGDSPQHGNRGPVNKRKRLLATSNINVSGGSAESDQPKQMAQVMATSTTSGGELVAGNIEVGDGEDCMSSPCTLLTEYGNASPANIPLQTTATALVVVPNEHVSLGLEELLNNCMHGTAHQFNLYAQWPDSSFLHDSSLLIASWEEDDPFARST